MNIHESPTAVEFRFISGLIVVEAELNGIGVPMIVDTGAGATLVRPQLVKRLGLESSENTCNATGAGGDVYLKGVAIESLRLGSGRVDDMNAMSMDLSAIADRLDVPVEGVIGSDFLKNFRVAIDYPARTLTLGPPRDERTAA